MRLTPPHPMKRLVLAGTFCLVLLAPAHAISLLDVRVAAPVTAQVSPTFHLRAPSRQALAANLLLQGTFTYGSGGTSADAWVQTSIDGGTTSMTSPILPLANPRLVFLQFEFRHPGEHRIHADRRNVGSEYLEGRLGRPHLAGQIHRSGHLRRGNDIARRRLRPGRHVFSVSDLAGNAHGFSMVPGG